MFDLVLFKQHVSVVCQKPITGCYISPIWHRYGTSEHGAVTFLFRKSNPATADHITCFKQDSLKGAYPGFLGQISTEDNRNQIENKLSPPKPQEGNRATSSRTSSSLFLLSLLLRIFRVAGRSYRIGLGSCARSFCAQASRTYELFMHLSLGKLCKHIILCQAMAPSIGHAVGCCWVVCNAIWPQEFEADPAY